MRPPLKNEPMIFDMCSAVFFPEFDIERMICPREPTCHSFINHCSVIFIAQISISTRKNCDAQLKKQKGNEHL